MSNFLRLIGGAAKEVTKRKDEQRAKTLELDSIEQKAKSTAYWESVYDGSSTNTINLGNDRTAAFKPVVGEGISEGDIPIIARENWVNFGQLSADEQATILKDEKAKRIFMSTVVTPLILEKQKIDIEKYGEGRQLATTDLEQLWGDRSTWTPSEVDIYREVRAGTGLSNKVVKPNMKDRYADDWDADNNRFNQNGKFKNIVDVDWLNSKGNVEQQIGTFFKGPKAPENYVNLGQSLFDNSWSNGNKCNKLTMLKKQPLNY